MENGEGGGCGSSIMINRAEIDTRAPFRSVKEAVMIFGEKVLAAEIYAHQLSQIRAAATKDESHATRLGSLVAELEETRQDLEKEREESQMMAHCLASLQEELEMTKSELTQLKSRQPYTQALDSETEDLKFVENAPEVEIMIESPMTNNTNTNTNDQGAGFQKKRAVKFANPPSLAQIINPEQEPVLERQFSVDGEATWTRKKKKKHLIPLITAIFAKKKGHQDGA